MNDFKLLAIRPLKDCKPHYLKVLKEGQIYKFYNEYTFNREDENDIHSPIKNVVFNQKIPDNLYSDKSLKINISAVVGKNGSGKSSLIEFLYHAVYILGNSVLSVKDSDNKTPILQTYADSVINEIRWRLKSVRKRGSIVGRVRKINELIRQYPEEKKIHSDIVNDFKGSVFYILNDVFYELRIDRDPKIKHTDSGSNESILPQVRDLKIINVLQDSDKLNPDILNHFFYTISINYSHYALNSNAIGNWINTLFHKNDGYRTPAVINPKRTKGNFDINEENLFAKYRLLSNILVEKLNQTDQTKEIYITDRQFIKSIRFTYNKKKLKQLSIRDTGNELRGMRHNNREVMLLMDLYSQFFPGYTYLHFREQKLPFRNELGNYIIQKIDQIIDTYDLFDEGYDYDLSIDNQSERTNFIQKLLDNPSHIVFKLKQALNFSLQNLHSKKSLWDAYFEEDSEQIYDFSISELLEWMNVSNVQDILSHLPPAIFDIDFQLSNLSGESSSLKDLSSGEQQMIHSMQSAIYHINNLESIHNSIEHNVKYENINIIYDEIELYFHPEFQREFISRFQKALSRLNLAQKENGIKSINILFSTHSPFILSDIPSSNILRLVVNEDGKSIPIETNQETFGANIHYLLANDFFLKDGFMGEFATKKINDVINFLNHEKIDQRLSALDREKDKIECTKLQSQKEQLEEKNQELSLSKCEELILLIGEPAIRETLLGQYYELIKNDKQSSEGFFQRLAKSLDYNISKNN